MFAPFFFWQRHQKIKLGKRDPMRLAQEGILPQGAG